MRPLITPSPGAMSAPPAPVVARGWLLVMGLGNDLITDDAIGLLIARRLHKLWDGHPDIDVIESGEMGLGLLDHVCGYQDLVLVDAVQSRQVPPGHLHDLGVGHLPVLPGVSPHFMGVGEILALGQALGMPVPKRVRILAVEALDLHTMGTALTKPLQDALPRLIEQVRAIVEQITGDRD